MADELKSFEQTHWLRVYVASEIYSEEVSTDTFLRCSFMTGFARLPRMDKEAYLVKADARIIEFKQKYESLVG